MITKQENNNSAFHILELLSKEAKTKYEIMEKLNIKAPTFYKYIHILKKAGFNIIKKQGKYKIKNYKGAIELAGFEESILAYLGFLSFDMLPYSKFSTFFKTLENMLQLCNKRNFKNTFKKFDCYKVHSINNNFKNKIETLQKHIEEKNIIKITTATKKELIFVPLAFAWEKNRIYLHFLDNNKMKKGTILLKNIARISSNGEKEISEYANETIFEIYGRLAQIYVLKDSERILNKFKDKIVVANSASDKIALFKRLLRYDVLCKVIFPKNDVIEFENLINKSLDNID